MVQISTSWPWLARRRRPRQPCRLDPAQPCRHPSKPRWPSSDRDSTSLHRRQHRFAQKRMPAPWPGSRCTLAAGRRPRPSGLLQVPPVLLRVPVLREQAPARVQRREPVRAREHLPSSSRRSARQRWPPEQESSSFFASPLKIGLVLPGAQSAPGQQCGPLHCLDHTPAAAAAPDTISDSSFVMPA
jgi:hypothetical protein